MLRTALVPTKSAKTGVYVASALKTTEKKADYPLACGRMFELSIFYISLKHLKEVPYGSII
jgi:hypothetical protein